MSLLVALLLVHPLDAFLAAAEAAELVIVVPRLDHVTEPLAAGLQRARQVPALAPHLGREDALPWALIEPDFQAKNGLDPRGSLAYAVTPSGPVLRLPVASREAVPGLLAALGRTVTADAAGWQTEEGVARFSGGGLYGARTEAMLAGFLLDRGDRAALARCPRGAGEADLFILARAETGRGCATVRVDADRLVLEARGEGLPDRWFGDGDTTLLDRVGAGSTTLVTAHLAPAVLAKAVPAAEAERLRPLLLAFDGRIALGSGPSTSEATVALGVADAEAVRRILAEQAAPLNLAPVGPDTWQLVTKNPIEIKGLPKIEAAWVGLRPGVLLIATDRARLDAPPAASPLAAGLAGAVLGVANRTGGRPHDGRTVLDQLAPVLGGSLDEARPWVLAAAWIGGHLGAWTIRVGRAGAAADLRAEVELL